MVVSGDSAFKAAKMKFPVVLKAGKSKKMSVSFKSKERGTFSGTLLLFTNDPNNSVIEITLQGSK